MLTAERRQHILERLRREGKVLASELSNELQVSEDTIRRDLRELAEAGLLQRVHGGALPRSPAAVGYAARQQQAPLAKAAIAQAAVELLRPGQVVLMDGGTTTLQVAQRIPAELRLTVITNSPPVAIALAEHPCAEVIILGGRLHKQAPSAIGVATISALQAIRADMYMLGVCSLHPDVGISNPDYEESLVKRAMIASAAEVVALASAEKLGTAESFVVGPLSELTHLITERGLAPELLEPYRALGITVIQA